MIDFLSEALTLSHIIPAVFCQLEVQELSPVRLKGVLLGNELTSFDDDIKAVTYHKAEVKQGPYGSWSTNIIFDI
jgi:SHS2 domain-containing protein